MGDSSWGDSSGATAVGATAAGVAAGATAVGATAAGAAAPVQLRRHNRRQIEENSVIRRWSWLAAHARCTVR